MTINSTQHSIIQSSLLNFGKNQKQEKDPYRSYPLRIAAYSNELGTALQPTIGSKAALVMWLPALTYFGMDINDKYKKGTHTDDKNLKTGFRAAVFHTLASITLPTGVIYAAQKGVMSLKNEKDETLFSKAFNYIQKNGPKYFKSKDEMSAKALPGWMKALHKIPIAGKVLISDPVEEMNSLKEMGFITKGAQRFSTTFKTAVGLATLAVAAIPIDILTERVFMKPINYALGLKGCHEKSNPADIKIPEKLLTLENRLK